MFPLKKPISIEQQIALLESRGMTIPDHERAGLALSSYGYYRLSGYMLQMKRSKSSSEYRPGSNFDDVLQLYEFDMELRHVLLCAIDQIEINCRAKIVQPFVMYFGEYGHYREDSFDSPASCDKFVMKLDKAIGAHRHLPCVKHHIDKYSNTSINPPVYYMPLWAAVEILTINDLSKFYKTIKPKTVKHEIAHSLNASVEMLENWLYSTSTLRNICAHHGRLYDREIYPGVKYEPKLKAAYSNEWLATTRFYGCLPMLIRLLPDEDSRRMFIKALKPVVLNYQDVIDLKCIGFPKTWESQLSAWPFVE